MGTRTLTTLIAATPFLTTACAEWHRWPPQERAQSQQPQVADEEPPIPQEVAGVRILGAVVEDPTEFLLGTLEDLILDTGTGEVVAAVVTVEGPHGGPRSELLRFDALEWRFDESGFHAAVFAEHADELATAKSADPFDGRELAGFEGEIVEVRDSRTPSKLLKVRDDENLLHRVLVGAAGLVAQNGIALEPGQRLAVEGIQTRDDKGKLWITCSLAQDGTRLTLRDAAGLLQLASVARPFLLASELGEVSLTAEGGSLLRITDCVLDLRQGIVVRLLTQSTDASALEGSFDWDAIERGASGWTVAD